MDLTEPYGLHGGLGGSLENIWFFVLGYVFFRNNHAHLRMVLDPIELIKT